MSEIKYRRLLRQLLVRPPRDFNTDNILFANIMLESGLPLIDQVRLLLAADDKNLSYHALTIVQRIRIDEFAPELIHMIHQGEKADAKFYIMVTLGFLRHQQIIPFLLNMVQTSEDLSDRRLAAHILKDSKLPLAVIPALMTLAQDVTEPPEVRSLIIEGLLDNRLMPVATLLPLLQDHSAEVRWVALCGLEYLGNISLRSHVEPLVDQMWMVREQELVGTRAKRVLARWERRSEEKTDE